jgi:hypothetical protein
MNRRKSLHQRDRMGTETNNDLGTTADMLIWKPGFAVFFTLLAGCSLYLDVKHASSRFRIPHDLMMQHAFSGPIGWVFDVACFLFIIFLFIEFVRSAQSKLELAWFVSWIAPLVINPLRMAIPAYTAMIWWAESCLNVVFFVASVLVLLKLFRNRRDKQSNLAVTGSAHF